jgi:hypothetical protein
MASSRAASLELPPRMASGGGRRWTRASIQSGVLRSLVNLYQRNTRRRPPGKASATWGTAVV